MYFHAMKVLELKLAGLFVILAIWLGLMEYDNNFLRVFCLQFENWLMLDYSLEILVILPSTKNVLEFCFVEGYTGIL